MGIKGNGRGRGRDRQSIPGRTSTPGSPALSPQLPGPARSGNGQYMKGLGVVPQRLEGAECGRAHKPVCIDVAQLPRHLHHGHLHLQPRQGLNCEGR